MQTPKKMIFHGSNWIVRLQVLICYVNPQFPAYHQKILLESPGLSVVSDPRSVLRYKQGRLTL